MQHRSIRNLWDHNEAQSTRNSMFALIHIACALRPMHRSHSLSTALITRLRQTLLRRSLYFMMMM